MILSKKLSEAFNAQVNAEMWSSNLYLSMSVHFQKLGLNGFAHWMKKQAEEENGACPPKCRLHYRPRW